jgi:twitching motility protein PilT
LEMAVANQASDVHLATGSWPKLRVQGQLVEVTGWKEMSREENEKQILSMLSEEQVIKLKSERELDFSIAIEQARFRANVYYQRGDLAAALRIVPNQIPTMETLNLPLVMKDFLKVHQGFVLVTGPTGQGKSTTVASMLEEINTTQARHLVTIEDPIEYVIEPKKSIVSQREVLFDTLSFQRALKSCLRQDPNIVFVGEMRDLETISSALTVAETGHLVFSTLHTNSAAQTIDRVIDVFPEGTKAQVRMQLASVLTAIVSQRLIPTVDGKRYPVFEILIANGAVKNSIREGKTFMIDNIIQTSAEVGMVSLETSLARLVKEGRIAEEVALNYCLRPSELQGRLRGRL